MKVKVVQNQKMMNQALKIREAVFIIEQKIPLSEEVDEYETQATHFLAYNTKNQPIATCRIRIYQKDKIKIERMCVLKPYRTKKINEKIMNYIEKEAKKKGFKSTILSIKNEDIFLYQKLGYKVYFDESNNNNHYESVLMEKIV